jgi:hypothetical protein
MTTTGTYNPGPNFQISSSFGYRVQARAASGGVGFAVTAIVVAAGVGPLKKCDGVIRKFRLTERM